MLFSPATNDIDLLSPVNWDDPLTHGLAFWHLNLPGRFGGTHVYDLVSGRLLTRTNMASPPTSTSGPGTTTRQGGWGEERLQTSLNNYVQVASSQVLFNQPNFTISAWVKPITNVTFYYVYTETISAGAVLFLRLSNGGKLQFGISDGVGFPIVTGASTLAAAAWSHVAARKIGVTMSVWLNGMVDGTTTFTGYNALPVTSVQLGRDTTVGSEFPFDGVMDDIVLSVRALDMPALYADSRTFHPRMLRRIEVPWGQAAGGTTYTQSLGGTLATGATVPRTTNKALVGAL